ncbi:MAG: RIP metalloprotease RseP [bacterium]|nr:RIP metalloprotease RseP [bacterium]
MFALFTFLIVLGLLVFVHELGHFLVARKSGMDVEEFGFGFPPRLVGFQRRDGRWHVVGARAQWQEGDPTIYSINWLPLGGFVRIRGENGGEGASPRSFVGQPRWKRAMVLVAGVAMNLVLAVVLFTTVFAVGAPQMVDDLPASARVRDVQTTVVSVLKASAADAAGVLPGDAVQQINGVPLPDPDAVRAYIQEHLGQELAVTVVRDGATLVVTATPGPLPGTDRAGLGVELVTTGIVSYPLHRAAWEGVRTTGFVVVEIARALGRLVVGLFTEQAVTVDIAGPIGIAVLTGQVARLGITHLLQFAAVLSANLAFINIFPFPALDGGRLLFLGIEAIRRRPLSRRVEGAIHAVGFAFLMGLVLVVTFRDIATFGGGFLAAVRGAVGM